MEIQHLKYFVDSVRCGSFAKAAEELYVTRQTISGAVSQLEDELGFALLKRNKNGVELTEDGAVFYDRIRQMFEEFGRLSDDMKEYAARYRPRVRIGIAQFFDYRDAEYIQGWIQENPQYHAELIYCQENESIRMMENGELDFLLTKMTHEINPNYTSEIVANNRIALYVHQDNPLYHKEYIEVSDLKGQTLISTDFGLEGRQYLDQASMPELEGVARLVNSDSMHNISLLLANRGVMIGTVNTVIYNHFRDLKVIPFAEEYYFPYYLNASVETMKNKVYYKIYRSLKKYLTQTYRAQAEKGSDTGRKTE